MKHRSPSPLLSALAFGIAAMAQAAGVFPGSTDFEDMAAGALPSDGFFAGNTADASIVADATVATQIAAADRPTNFDYAATREKVLSVDTTTNAPVVRTLEANGAVPAPTDSSGNPIPFRAIYADLLVQGAVARWDEEIQPTSADDKILVYFKETAENGVVVGTNLYVRAGIFDTDNSESVPGGREYMVTTPASVGAFENGTWYRIVLEYDPAAVEGWDIPAFRIYFGGYGSDFLCTGTEPWFVGSDDTLAQDVPDWNTMFPSLESWDAPTPMRALAFAGSGKVDDLVLSINDPGAPPPTTTVTLSWPTSIYYVAYVLDGATNELNVANGTATIDVPAGSTITLIGGKAREIEVEVVASGDTATLALPADGVEWYFPQTATPDQDGSAANPFEIATAGDLYTLADLVQTTNCAGLFFQQVADIDFTDEAPFAGIGTYDADPRLGTPFTGVYDGGDYFISNITFTARTYGGLFNQVNGGTIKNLYVSNAWVSAEATGEYGFAIVGNAGNGATLQNLCSFGTFGTPEKPGTHNMAGIVVRASGGGEDGTLVQGCVNAADVYGTYTKIAGVCAIAQHKADGGSVRFDICSNSGDIVAMAGGTAGRDGVAGIVAYSDDDVVISDSFNTGSLSSTLATAKIGEIVGYHKSRSLTGEGRIGASADRKMIHTEIDANLTGFDYALVDDGRAETTDALEADETYLLERSIVDSGEPVFELENEGDWIAFDAKFGYDFLGEISFADGGVAVATNGTVITYTAVAAAADPWFIPEQGADAATIRTNLGLAGLSPNTNVVRTAGDYVALVGYATNRVAGAAEPADLTANQRTNAVLCFALNAAAIPDVEIADGDLAVAAVEPAAGGAMEIAISIDGVTVGDLSVAAAQALAARALAGTAGGDDLDDLSADNVTIRVTGSEGGDILAEVVPNPDVYAEPPAAFFVQPVISK